MRKKRAEVVKMTRAEAVRTRRAEVVKTRGTGGENKESSGNLREKAGKQKNGKRKNVQQKEDKRMSEEGLSGGRMIEYNKSREKECGSEEER